MSIKLLPIFLPSAILRKGDRKGFLQEEPLFRQSYPTVFRCSTGWSSYPLLCAFFLRLPQTTWELTTCPLECARMLRRLLLLPDQEVWKLYPVILPLPPGNLMRFFSEYCTESVIVFDCVSLEHESSVPEGPGWQVLKLVPCFIFGCSGICFYGPRRTRSLLLNRDTALFSCRWCCVHGRRALATKCTSPRPTGPLCTTKEKRCSPCVPLMGIIFAE